MQNILSPILYLSGDPKRKDIKILYDYSNSIFDKFLIKHLDMSFMYESEYIRTRGMFCYDIYWNNDPVQYTSNASFYKSEHILDMIFFHESPDPALKKEDKFLLQNRLGDSFKIYTNESLKSEWSIDNGKYIPYGIPKVKIDFDQPRKSVVLLNPNNAKSVDILYSYVKKYFPDAGIINIDQNISYEKIISTLKEYNICISIKKTFDSLIALSCGCDVLSSSVPEEEGIINIDDFNKIHLIIESTLKIRNVDKIKDRISFLAKKYDLVKFQDEIYDTIINRIKEPLLL